MLSIGEGAAIEVVDDGTGALVAALAGAVDISYRLAVVLIESIDSIDEAFGGPGVRLYVYILVSAGCLESIVVDSHAVSRHNNRILIAGTVSGEAGGNTGGIDLSEVFLIPEVSQVYHVAFGTPVCNQTLGAFHDEVRSSAAFESGVDLVVAVGVVKILNSDFDAGGGFKICHQGFNCFRIAPFADRIRPEGDLCCGFCTCDNAERCYHAKCENNCQEFLHFVYLR